MNFKFSLVDDESELIIGYCKNVIGLNGKQHCVINNKAYHKLILTDFYFNDSFKKYSQKSTNIYINNLYVTIINKYEEPIGSYYFYLSEPVSFYKTEFIDNGTNLELIGILTQIASSEAIKLWDLWREESPTKKNQWADLSEEERRGWLEIVKMYNFQIRHEYEEKVHQTINLDGTYITDYYSFFCALGEAINGPGGYFGDDFSSLRDCLCGGFGIISPFTIIWSKSHIAMKKLNKEAWIRAISYKKQMIPDNLDGNIFLETGEKSLFGEIIELFNEENINIIFDN